MQDPGAGRTRRAYLKRLLGAGLLTGLAGCQSSGDESDPTEAASETTTPASADTDTDTPTARSTSTPTATPTPDQPPRIVTHSATPEQNGQALAFAIEAEDDTALKTVQVAYADNKWTRKDTGEAQFSAEGRFTELGSSNPADGRVAFVVEDNAGQEARKHVAPDEQAPALSEFIVEPTQNAGEVTLTLQGETTKGLRNSPFTAVTARKPTAHAEEEVNL
ncbi:hypothetical protein [Halovenus salina]|uniref:Uncharacterized protein n=1 Tax=Halovenus salina TaxID=1510225 RepID=A0ABD5W6Z7_9EURY